jgi:Domain of unknown function (DUF4185)
VGGSRRLGISQHCVGLCGAGRLRHACRVRHFGDDVPKKDKTKSETDRHIKRKPAKAVDDERNDEAAKGGRESRTDTKATAPASEKTPAGTIDTEADADKTPVGTTDTASSADRAQEDVSVAQAQGAPVKQTPADAMAGDSPVQSPAATATPEFVVPVTKPQGPLLEQQTVSSSVKKGSVQASGSTTSQPEASPRATGDETTDRTVKAVVTHDAVESVPQPATVAVTRVGGGSVVTAVMPVQETVKAQPSLGGVIRSVPVGVQKMMTSVLGAFGFNRTSASSPNAPTGIGALVMGLVGWGSRRESEQVVALTSAATPIAATLVVEPLAAVAVSPTLWVGWLTGPNSVNNTLARFGVYGTDLGIMWDNGVTGDNPNTAIVEQRQILFAFGDTFSDAAMTQNWRNNILLRSADNVLSDGIYVPDGTVDRPGIPDGAYSGSPMSLSIPNYSREIIGKYPYSTSTQVTIIPTGAISVPGAGANGATRQYVAFMSIKQWGAPGSWTTNYAAISYSDDNGQNWTVVPQSSVRAASSGSSTVPYKSGNENFQMVSFVKPPAGSADAAAGYVYATGTPAGRNGTVYLSRVKEANILDVSKYDYWDGKKWVSNAPSAAKPILPGTSTGILWFKKTTYPSAGELSVQYNTYLHKYVMLYTDSANNVVMRTADSMNGTWSSATTLATSAQYPGLYAPMIHPWSGTNLLKKADGSVDDPQYLYWNMSLWGDYNVTLMKTDLSQLGLTYV